MKFLPGGSKSNFPCWWKQNVQAQCLHEKKESEKKTTLQYKKKRQKKTIFFRNNTPINKGRGFCIYTWSHEKVNFLPLLRVGGLFFGNICIKYVQISTHASMDEHTHARKHGRCAHARTHASVYNHARTHTSVHARHTLTHAHAHKLTHTYCSLLPNEKYMLSEPVLKRFL